MENEERIVLTKGNNRRRLILKQIDLHLLRIICFERFLTEKQLYRNYLAMSLKEISYPGFWKKLEKYEEYGLLKSYKYRVGQNGTIVKYFRISKNGLKLLIDNKLLNEKGLFNSIPNIPKNFDHFFGTKETILRSLLELFNRGIMFPVISSIGSKSKVYPKIIPDSVLKSKDFILYIEFDTGSETIKEVQNKIKCYLKELDKFYYPKEAIIVSLLDNTIPNKKGIDDRSKRIINLYKAIISLPEFYRTWIDVYLLPLKNSQKAALEFFSNTPLIIKNKVAQLIRILEGSGLYTNYNVELSENFFVNIKEQYGLVIDGIFIHDKTSFSMFASVFLYMQPGSIRNNFNLQRITTLQLSSEVRTEFVYAIYRDKESMEEDIKIFGTIKGVRYINLEEMDLQFQKSPYFYAKNTKGAFRKIKNIEEWPKLF